MFIRLYQDQCESKYYMGSTNLILFLYRSNHFQNWGFSVYLRMRPDLCLKFKQNCLSSGIILFDLAEIVTKNYFLSFLNAAFQFGSFRINRFTQDVFAVRRVYREAFERIKNRDRNKNVNIQKAVTRIEQPCR